MIRQPDPLVLHADFEALREPVPPVDEIDAEVHHAVDRMGPAERIRAQRRLSETPRCTLAS